MLSNPPYGKSWKTDLAERDEAAAPVVKKTYRLGRAEPDPLHGRLAASIDGAPVVVEYEPDAELRDTEQVPLLEAGGAEVFSRREVLPYVPDAWIDDSATKIGYEISFTRYFYKPQPAPDPRGDPRRHRGAGAGDGGAAGGGSGGDGGRPLSSRRSLT